MSDEPSGFPESFTDQAKRFWELRGGRMTHVRKEICEQAARRDCPFTADDLWREIRKRDQGISIASVYRTLSDLAKTGLLREIPRQGEQCLYVSMEHGSQAKGHLICKDCKQVISLSADCLALREGAVVKALGFQSAGMNLRIEAHCEDLRQTGTCGRCEAK